MNKNEINAKIEELRKIEAQAAKLKEAADMLRDELKAELDSRKVDSVDTGLHRIFYNCYEKSSVNTDALKEAGLYDLYTKKSTVVQFRISDVKAVQGAEDPVDEGELEKKE